jgi:hypothetical protein
MKVPFGTPQIMVLLTASAFLFSGTALAESRPDLNHQLRSRIAKVRRAKTTAERLDAAERLVALTDGRDCSAVTNETIHSLVSLLDIEDDGVRMWVAAALGDVGPRASEAIPKLLSILSVSDCMIWDHSSAATIPIALKRMGVDPPSRNCIH